MIFVYKLFFLYFILLFSNSVSADDKQCDSGLGICIDVTVETCSGILYGGLCPGNQNIICCEAPISCHLSGHCINSLFQSCGEGEILKAGYCPGDSAIQCCELPDAIPESCFLDGPSLPDRTFELTLRNQGFEDHPGALVHFPTTFDASKADDLEIIVYVHGYDNCIRNIVRNKEDACNCSVNGEVRESYALLSQFDQAAEETTRSYNWIFIAAEVAYDQANDSPGRWAEENLFREYLNEILVEHISPIMGGYYVIGNMATVGGMTKETRDLVLLDSLYTNFDQFDSFVQTNLLSFGVGYNQFRFSSVYTSDGGTYTNNINMASRAFSWVTSANVSEIYYFDNFPVDTMETTVLHKFSLIFQLTDLSHNDVPRNLFYDYLVGEE